MYTHKDIVTNTDFANFIARHWDESYTRFVMAENHRYGEPENYRLENNVSDWSGTVYHLSAAVGAALASEWKQNEWHTYIGQLSAQGLMKRLKKADSALHKQIEALVIARHAELAAQRKVQAEAAFIKNSEYARSRLEHAIREIKMIVEGNNDVTMVDVLDALNLTDVVEADVVDEMSVDPIATGKRLTVAEYAAKHNMHPNYVRKLAANGKLPADKNASNQWVIYDTE